MGHRAVHFYFKLFKNIKSEHESTDLAKLELESLFGEVAPIYNFVDYALEKPLCDVLDAKFAAQDLENGKEVQIRFKDILTHEPPYGKIQGYYGVKSEVEDISSLIKRLAYTREIIIILKTVSPKNDLEKFFPQHELNYNTLFTQEGEYSIFRFITHQYFLEKSEYISKLSRNEKEIDQNVIVLFNNLMGNFYRIPASSTMRVGKRLHDYFSIREENSLYLTHYMHPYKGKFHPKMVRAILNYLFLKNKGLVMDNFAGSGTLLVEATWMGLDSIGVEINPLSVLMSNVKCYSLALDPGELEMEISNFLVEVEKALRKLGQRVIKPLEHYGQGHSLLTSVEYDFNSIMQFKRTLPSVVVEMFKNPETVDKILVAHEILKKVEDERVRNFLFLGLSGTISDLSRRSSADFLEVFTRRLRGLYLRIYLFHKLNDVLRIELGKSETYIGDTRNMRERCERFEGGVVNIKDDSIDAIVNSPPYSTALDYIRNDFPQLVLLNFTSSLDKLETDMIGNPNLKYYTKELLNDIKSEQEEYTRLPDEAKRLINKIIKSGREKEAIRTYKFFKDMYLSIKEMCRVMKPGAKCAIIIGNNHYKLDGNYEEIKNDEVILQIAEKEGFKKDKVITRELEKSMTGMIRYESIVILEKV
nr:DNA methyltransferase [Candidatus Freyarchaeota archaeon]